MDVDEQVRAITAEETRGSLALWFGVLGSPAAWAGHVVLNYALEEWFACSPSVTEPGEVLGFGVRSVAVVINTAMLLIAVASGLTALVSWRRLRAARDGNSLDRATFMAFAGIVEGCIFVATILTGYAAPLVLDPCGNAP